MLQIPTPLPTPGWTVADVLGRFGPIPISRIRRAPPPGEATSDDVEQIYLREKRLCELVDGVLVEKTGGIHESCLAMEIARILGNFVAEHRIGAIFGADGMMRLAPDLIRIPDVSFVSTARLPDGRVPRTTFMDCGPDLAVEVISPSNTTREMNRKLEDYFTADVKLVWHVYPETREVHVYTSVEECAVLGAEQILDGGDVLPGFELKLANLFAESEKQS